MVILCTARLANALLKDEESARDNHVFASTSAKYSPILWEVERRVRRSGEGEERREEFVLCPRKRKEKWARMRVNVLWVCAL